MSRATGEPALATGADVLANAEDAEQLSPLERIRAKRRRPLRERTEKLVIPNYGGELRVVYGYIEFEDANAITRRRKPGETEVDRAADLLCRMCRAVEVRVEQSEDGEDVYAPLHEVTAELGSEPVCFDERLAKALDIEIADPQHPARSVVYQAFDSDYAIVAQQVHLILWLSDPEDDEEDFAEGSATTRTSETPST